MVQSPLCNSTPLTARDKLWRHLKGRCVVVRCQLPRLFDRQLRAVPVRVACVPSNEDTEFVHACEIDAMKEVNAGEYQRPTGTPNNLVSVP